MDRGAVIQVAGFWLTTCEAGPCSFRLLLLLLLHCCLLLLKDLLDHDLYCSLGQWGILIGTHCRWVYRRQRSGWVDRSRRQRSDWYADCLTFDSQTLPQLLGLQELLWAGVK